MTADNHVSRGSPLIGAARQSLRRANWLDQPRGSGSWAVDFRESGRILAYSEECINPRCKLCNGTLWCLWSDMKEDRTCLVNDI